MKKIVLTLALAIFAFAASAQIVISANIGGSMTSGNSYIRTVQEGGLEFENYHTTPLEATSSFVGGIKFGFQFGKCQAGIAASYNQATLYNMPLDPTIVPILQNSPYPFVTTGDMTIKNSAFTISPYFRYDIIKAGDVALFAELNILYTKSLAPVCTASIHDSMIGGTYVHDTTGTFPHPIDVTTLGVSVTPGLSWQLSKHCGIDLYLDFLALAYTQTTTIRTDFEYSFIMSGTTPKVEYKQIESTLEEKHFGAAITGTPLLTSLGANNWVRVGFNFTF